MSFTFRLYCYWVSIFLVFYVGVIVVVQLLWGMNVVIWQAALVFFIVGMIPPGILTFLFSKRLNYMESDNIDPPDFTGQKKMTFTFKGNTKFPFDEVLQRVDRQWIISYSDRQNEVLKFRTDSRMASWGLGGYLRMYKDGEEGGSRVVVIVYPIHSKSKRESVMVTQTLRVMRTIL